MLLVLAIHVELADAVNAELLLLELDFVGGGRKFGGEGPDVVREGGREEDDLDRVCTGEQTGDAWVGVVRLSEEEM
jgi:hypothetical protein